MAAAQTAPDAVGGGWLHGGAWGEYFNNTTLSGTPAFARRDVRIDFSWGAWDRPGGSPSAGYAEVGPADYSVRWTGTLMPRFSENYTFKLLATDGARLCIAPAGTTNWVSLLDAWNAPGTNSASQALSAGQAYALKLEYVRHTGPGTCRLLWSSPSTPEELVDAATLAGLNIATYGDRLWANIMDGARDSWTRNALDTPVSRDSNGWPLEDAYNIAFEGQNAATVAGRYLLQFTGRAQVEVNVFGPVTWSANGTNYGSTLPFGRGYDPVSNITTAELTLTPTNAGICYLHFSQTRRNPADTTMTGVTGVKLMRPLGPGSTSFEPVGNVFANPLKTALRRYAVIRWIANFDTDREWPDRVLPSYAARADLATSRYWEHMVLLANETGKDLHVCLPVRASNAYLTNVANLIRYGSDGVAPYTSAQANPVFPPLNPNLRVILEHENEVWNWAFANFGNNLEDLRAAVARNDPDWAVVNYDGAYTQNPDGAWLRWHILRGVRTSDIFRGVFGDAAMGSRVRVIYEYQYNDENGTASGALPFVDNYFNNADGTNHVAVPRPVNHYFWGAGAAVYYGSGNAHGEQTACSPANADFETPSLNAGEARTAPAGAGWTFSGTAGMYSAAALAPLWTNGNLGTPQAAAPSRAYGCAFTVGNDPVAVYELGRWITAGNVQWHTLHLIDTNRHSLATASVNAGSGAPGAYLFAPLQRPVLLSPRTTYYLVSEENAGGDAFLAGTTATPAPGISIEAAVTASYTANWDESTYVFTPVQAGAQVFGPVNLRGALAPVGPLGYPPAPPSGRQAAFVQGTGSVSQALFFPQAGSYALSFLAAHDPSLPNTFRFYYDDQVITPDGGSGIAPTTNQWFAGNGWGLDGTRFDTYATFVFQVPAPGTHTLRIQGLGWSYYSQDLDLRRVTYFDRISIASADALFQGGIPGAGQANGQIASDDYRAQLFAQARYPWAYGLQVVAYEGGWSLGGDFQSTAFQNWCKYHDPRAADAQLSSLRTFAESGGRYCIFGTYETWPSFDTANAGQYPLTQAVDVFNDHLPPEPRNGLLVPNELTPATHLWSIQAAANTATIRQAGGWFCWNVLVPNSSWFTATAGVSSPSNVVVEVDGMPLADNPATTPATFHLTRGLHNVKVRSRSGAVVVTNLTLLQIGAPNPPAWNEGNPVGDGFAELSWTPATNGPAALGYLLRYGTNPGSYTASVAIGPEAHGRLTGLVNGQDYYCVVLATNAAGHSLPSAEWRVVPVTSGQRQNLVLWDFLAAGGNAANDGNVAAVAATYRAYGVQPAIITRGSGTPPGVMYWGFFGRGAMNLNPSDHWISPSLAAAKANQDYFQITVAPETGKRLSLESLAYTFYQQNEHPAATLVLEYSTNGFATDGVPISTQTNISHYWTGRTNTVSLTNYPALQGVSGPVTFRLWGYNFPAWQDKGLGGVPGHNDDVRVTGRVLPTTVDPPALSMSVSGGNLRLSWPSGTLLEATNLAGPWQQSPLSSPATVAPTRPQMFYRVVAP